MPVTRILGIFTCFPLFPDISTFPRLVVLLCFSWEFCHHPFHTTCFLPCLSLLNRPLAVHIVSFSSRVFIWQVNLSICLAHLLVCFLSLYGHVADLQCCVHFKRAALTVTRVHVSTLPGAFPTRVIIERGAEFPVPRNRSLYPMVSRVCGI